jgi:hypothetical protein
VPSATAAWAESTAAAETAIAAALEAARTSLELAEECEGCDPGTERLQADAVSQLEAMAETFKTVKDSAGAAVEDEADMLEDGTE